MPFFLLQASAPGSAPSALVQLVPVLLIFGIFYFLLLAPMRKVATPVLDTFGRPAAR